MTGTVYDIVRRIREYNEEHGKELCKHAFVEVVLDSHGRIECEICRSCGKLVA